MSDLIILHGCATVQLTKGQNTLIDERDAVWTSRQSWTSVWVEGMKSYYVIGTEQVAPKKRRNFHLHRAIKEREGGPIARGIEVDHKNRDTLDNRGDNLRLATVSQNRANSRKKSYRGAASSQYKGVSFHKKRQKWRAIIVKDKKQRELGVFASEVEAARAYNRAALELHGEFARINEGV